MGKIDTLTKEYMKRPSVFADVFNQLGGFNKHCIICEDVDLWCKIALSGKIYYINEPLDIYHRDNINMLSKNKNASCF